MIHGNVLPQRHDESTSLQGERNRKVENFAQIWFGHASSLILNSEVGGAFIGSFLLVFVFKLQASDATSAKLRSRRLKHFRATGCAAAGRPKKTTDGGPNGGQHDRVEPRKGTLACARKTAASRARPFPFCNWHNEPAEGHRCLQHLNAIVGSRLE